MKLVALSAVSMAWAGTPVHDSGDLSSPAGDRSAPEWRATGSTSSGSVGGARESSNRHLTLSFRPMAAAFQSADVQAEVRLNRQLAVVGHGVAGVPSAEWLTGRSWTFAPQWEETRRVGGGLGARYFLDDFEGGTFMGLDVDLIHSVYGTDTTANRLVVMPKTGCKYVTSAGLTFAIDFGIGGVVELASGSLEPVARSLAIQSGAHVGWTF